MKEFTEKNLTISENNKDRRSCTKVTSCLTKKGYIKNMSKDDIKLIQDCYSCDLENIQTAIELYFNSIREYLNIGLPNKKIEMSLKKKQKQLIKMRKESLRFREKYFAIVHNMYIDDGEVKYD